MNNNKKEDFQWNGQIEEWLKDFFLDPLTTYLDETEFRMDVFETENDYIVEALLPHYTKNNIAVTVNNDFLTILATSSLNSEVVEKKRTIYFPFSINKKEITAVFHHDILEIFVSKNSQCENTGKYITIQ
ncbi:Hsp20/alpha crystallin family protein [Niallia sp. 03133]|uniref:Hsp20/alpha crystallin family protein n=1 Tax=Niallia sp. 03133 TaxID=3458060 RepID=UPI004043BC61